ncbi:MAG TPA: sigma-70 family RNA polymerase sigma factor [Caldilineaceae bacterium]|nr:sigma-70 family RNA polymerase sigma factor [Caldilineaceae bacterium]
MVSNAQLIQRCLHGDAQAWEGLVDRYARLVYSIPARYHLSAAEADDIFQDAFLALAQHLHEVQDPDRLPAWLITTTRRLVWRALSKRRLEQPVEDEELKESALAAALDQAGNTMPTLQALLDGWSRQEALSQGLAWLSERCRQLLTMLYLDESEPSYETISTQLGIPKGSIGPSRTRCIQQLRLALEGLGFDPHEQG